VEWRYNLQRSEKSTRFAVAKAQVAQVFSGGARELISQILTDGHDKTKIRQQVQDLVKYCNACYGDIERQFNRTIKPINVEFRMRQPEDDQARQQRAAAILAAANTVLANAQIRAQNLAQRVGT